MSQFGNIVFIVWRESIEALLVVGILQAWLGQQGGTPAVVGACSCGAASPRAC